MVALTRSSASSLGEHPGDREEGGLQDRVRAPGEPGLAGDGVGVDREQPQPAVDDLLLHGSWQRVPHLVRLARHVEQQRRAVPGGGQDVHLVEHGEVVNADEPGLRHQPRGGDGVRTEAQVRGRQPAGLLRVVDEVGLGVHLRVLSEDLHGVLVRPDRPVGPDAVEDRPQGGRVLDVEIGVVAQARAPHVVGDADGEPRSRRVGGQLGEDPGHHARCELLRREAVAPADDARHRGQVAAGSVPR